MEKFEVVFEEAVPKKHSICYKTKSTSAGVTSIYIMRTHTGLDYPKKIKIVVEEERG